MMHVLIARVLMFAALASAAGQANSDALLAARTIQARSVVSPADLFRSDQAIPGALTDPAGAVGLEARVTIYKGRPLQSGDFGPPALIDRNEIVTLVFDHGGLSILTEGRALDRAALGARVRVMNLGSRVTVTGTVSGPGEITVP